jgi:DNA-binding LacI/PurR family transcriptional regulator
MAPRSRPRRAPRWKRPRELGYSPTRWPPALTTGRTKLIGLISNNFHNPMFLEVFDLFTRGLQDRGLRPLLVNLSDETDPETRCGCCGNIRSTA